MLEVLSITIIIVFHCCYSDEDDGDTLDWLPMAPEIEDPEEPGWGQLEVKSTLFFFIMCLCSLKEITLKRVLKYAEVCG